MCLLLQGLYAILRVGGKKLDEDTTAETSLNSDADGYYESLQRAERVRKAKESIDKYYGALGRARKYWNDQSPVGKKLSEVLEPWLASRVVESDPDEVCLHSTGIQDCLCPVDFVQSLNSFFSRNEGGSPPSNIFSGIKS